MKMIGITGGVGSGKSELLQYIEKHYKCQVIYSDLLAKEMQLPGEACYEPLVELLGKEVLDEQGFISKEKMARMIFSEKELLTRVNELVHPLVVRGILRRRDQASEQGIELFFVEAALLIENGFGEICDQLWYIYADPGVRMERLMASRGYSPEKSRSIMEGQLPDEVFRSHCQVVIDNSGLLEDSILQINKELEAYTWLK